MPISSPTAPKPRTPPSFLFQGPPGGSKSTTALQFPRVWIGDIDLNLNGPEFHLRQQRKLGLTYHYDVIPYDDDGKRLEPPAQWDRLKKKVDAAIVNPEVQTLVLDSLTHMNQVLIRWIMDKWKITADGATLERQHWIPFRNELYTIITKVRTAGKFCIMIAHETDILDKKGVVEKHQIAVSSRLKDYFGGFFTDVYRFTQRPGPGLNGAPQFFCNTTPTPRCDLKNSFGMPSEIETTKGAYEMLNKYMQLETLIPKVGANPPVVGTSPAPAVKA